jgi:hypothetical protein
MIILICWWAAATCGSKCRICLGRIRPFAAPGLSFSISLLPLTTHSFCCGSSTGSHVSRCETHTPPSLDVRNECNNSSPGSTMSCVRAPPDDAVCVCVCMCAGHNATMPVVHSVQASHGLASMGSRGPAPVVPGLGPLSMTTVGVASLGGAGGGGSGAGAGANGPRSGAGVSASEASGLGRYGASSAGPSLSMAHSGPPGPGPTMHGIGQLGTRVSSVEAATKLPAPFT